MLGLLLLAVAAACWLALVSWSYVDPGPNYATEARPQNWLGYWGSGISDALIQAFGLSAALLILPIAALGLQIAQGDLPRASLATILLGRILSCAARLFCEFSCAFEVASQSWAWRVGRRLRRLSSREAFGRHASFLLWPLFALLFGVAGGWCIGRACGLSLSEIATAQGRRHAFSRAHLASRHLPPGPRQAIAL